MVASGSLPGVGSGTKASAKGSYGVAHAASRAAPSSPWLLLGGACRETSHGALHHTEPGQEPNAGSHTSQTAMPASSDTHREACSVSAAALAGCGGKLRRRAAEGDAAGRAELAGLSAAGRPRRASGLGWRCFPAFGWVRVKNLTLFLASTTRVKGLCGIWVGTPFVAGQSFWWGRCGPFTRSVAHMI